MGAILWNLLPPACHNVGCLKGFIRSIRKLNVIRDVDFGNLYCKKETNLFAINNIITLFVYSS